MSNKPTGGPAFPNVDCEGWKEGMTLRDWFAGKALESMAGMVAFDQTVEDMCIRQGVKIEEFEPFTAHIAYAFADAMIAERNK